MSRSILKIILFTSMIFVSSLFSQNTKIKLNFGDLELPGKWDLLAKHEESGQASFKNIDTKVVISISERSKTKFVFYNDTLTDFEMVDAFYRWSANYWKKNKKYKVSEIKKDRKKKYVIWLIKAPEDSNYILNGIKKTYLIGLQIQGDETNAEERIKLLESIYLN